VPEEQQNPDIPPVGGLNDYNAPDLSAGDDGCRCITTNTTVRLSNGTVVTFNPEDENPNPRCAYNIFNTTVVQKPGLAGCWGTLVCVFEEKFCGATGLPGFCTAGSAGFAEEGSLCFFNAQSNNYKFCGDPVSYLHDFNDTFCDTISWCLHLTLSTVSIYCQK
jgi:hypothetical protein